MNPVETNHSSAKDRTALSSKEGSERSVRVKRAMVPATLPSCLSSHVLLDIGYDPSSGWCDLQGRRAYLEDTHDIRIEKEYKFFGVYDGINIQCFACCMVYNTLVVL